MVLDPVAGAIKDFIFDTTKPFTTGILDNIENMGTHLRLQGHKGFEGTGENTKQFYHGTAGFPKRVVTGWVEGVGKEVAPATNAVSEGVTSAASTVGDSVGWATSKAVKAGEAVGTSAVDGASWVAGKCAKTARKIGRAGYNAGESVAEGVTNAMRSGASLASKAVGKAFGLDQKDASHHEHGSHGS